MAILLNKTIENINYTLYLAIHGCQSSGQADTWQVIVEGWASQTHHDEQFLPIIRRYEVVTCPIVRQLDSNQIDHAATYEDFEKYMIAHIEWYDGAVRS